MGTIPAYNAGTGGEPGVSVTPEVPAPARAFPTHGIELGEDADIATSLWQKHKQIAADDQAKAAQTAYIEKSINIRSDFQGKMLNDAVSGYGEAAKALAEARKEILRGLPSRMAQDAFESKSEIPYRRELDMMASHLTTQRKAIAGKNHREAMVVGAKNLASMALIPEVSMGHIAHTVEDLVASTREFGLKQGYDAATVEDYVNKEMGVPMHALIKSLIDAKSPLAEKAFERWGGLLDPSFQGSAQKAIESVNVEESVANALANIPRQDAAGNANPRGALSAANVMSVTKDLIARGTPFDMKVADRISQEYKRDHERFAEAGDQLEEKVFAQGKGRGPGGRFGIPTESTDWQDFEALYPKRANALREKALQGKRQYTSDERTARHEQDKQAAGAVATELLGMSPDELRRVTNAGISARLRGTDGTHTPKVAALLARLQKGEDVKSPVHRGEIATLVKNVATQVGGAAFAHSVVNQGVWEIGSVWLDHPEYTREQLEKEATTWAKAQKAGQRNIVRRTLFPEEPYQPPAKTPAAAKPQAAATPPSAPAAKPAAPQVPPGHTILWTPPTKANPKPRPIPVPNDQVAKYLKQGARREQP